MNGARDPLESKIVVETRFKKKKKLKNADTRANH